MVIIPFHHIVNFPSGFDLFPIVKPALLLGGEIQEISGSPEWLSVLPEQVKGTLDVRHLFRIKTGLVIITGKTDDTVNSLAEDVVCFEQQETEAVDDMALPCNPVFNLVVSCVCSASLRLNSDWCLLSSFISSRWWSLCMVWILSCNRSMVSSCVEISLRKSSISFLRAFDFPVAQPTAAFRSSLPFPCLAWSVFRW